MLWSQFEGVMGSGAGGEVGPADAGAAAADVTMEEGGEMGDEERERGEDEEKGLRNR